MIRTSGLCRRIAMILGKERRARTRSRARVDKPHFKSSHLVLWLLGLVGFLIAFCVPKEVAARGRDLSATVATTSSSVAIDCRKKIAFVALRVLSGSTGNGLVKVLNVGVDPKNVDPRIETIDLGHPDYPSGIAVDPAHQIVIVVSGNNGNGGLVDLIDESTTPPVLVTGGVAPYAFPAGSDTNSGDESFHAPGLGQVIYDPSAMLRWSQPAISQFQGRINAVQPGNAPVSRSSTCRRRGSARSSLSRPAPLWAAQITSALIRLPTKSWRRTTLTSQSFKQLTSKAHRPHAP
jgi:hypothetical protein